MEKREMKDSFDHSIIPLGDDLKLRDNYITHMNNVRMGRLLEDMDIFAVHLLFKHMRLEKEPRNPFSIVTALLDRISVDKKINSNENIKMSGHVTWVGKSSAESTLNLHQWREDDKTWDRVLEARFVIVAKDALNQGTALINPLKATNDLEKRIFAEGQSRYEYRKNKFKDSLFQNPPSEEEKNIIHEFFIKTVDHEARTFKARVKPQNSVWMEDAKLKTVVLCQPEYRNVFNKIFGGFIMRQAFELGWACAYVYAGKRVPRIKYMDDILFERPVEIGSLLHFNSQVAFTQDNFIQVRVGAEALDPNTRLLQSTNVFHYTFELEGDPVPEIIPKTYHEAMMYLNSRRHFLACQNNLN